MRKVMPSIGRLITGTALVLNLTITVHAQPVIPVPPALTNPPPTPEQIAAEYAALVAAQQADYQTNYAPWAVQDIPMPDGSQLTSDALAAQSQADLLALSTNIYTISH